MLMFIMALQRDEPAGFMEKEWVKTSHAAQGCKSACCCVCATNTQTFSSVFQCLYGEFQIS